MNPENQSNIDLGGESREVYPEINIHSETNDITMVDGQESEIKPETAEVNYPEGFEVLAKSSVRQENSKIIDINEMNDASVIFQQDRTKDVLDILKNNSENAMEDIEKYWEEYHNMVNGYAKEFKNREDRNSIIKEFLKMEKSVIGSLGTIKFFKEQGFDLKFPTVRDDKLGACDLFFEKKDKKGEEYNLAVQLKSYMTNPVKNTSKDWQKKLKDFISINRFGLGEKDKKIFSRLQTHCGSLKQDSGKIYHPVIIKMPIDMAKRGESKPSELVNKEGSIQNKNMKVEMDFLWGQVDTTLTNQDNGLY